MTYELGIDIGTTFTAAAVHTDGATDVFPLSENRVDAPTMLADSDHGAFLVGWAAAKKLRSNPDAVVHSFKRRIGDPTPLKLGNREHEPVWYIGQIIRLIASEPAATGQSVEDALAMSPVAARGELRQLEDLGYIRRKKDDCLELANHFFRTWLEIVDGR